MGRSISQACGAALILGLAVFGLVACVQPQRQGLAPRPAASSFGLFYMDEGASVKLAYGAPNSDDVGFMMQCAKGSGRVEVSEVARAATAPPRLVLVSAGRKDVLNAAVTAADGAPLLTADTPSGGAVLRAFRRSGELHVGAGAAGYDVSASPVEKTRVERFFAACERAA